MENCWQTPLRFQVAFWRAWTARSRLRSATADNELIPRHGMMSQVLRGGEQPEPRGSGSPVLDRTSNRGFDARKTGLMADRVQLTIRRLQKD